MAENNTESTAVNELIELVATAQPLPPDPSEDLMFREVQPAMARSATKQMSAPRVEAAAPGWSEVEPLPRTRAPVGTQQNLQTIREVPPGVRITTARPPRAVSIPPLAPRDFGRDEDGDDEDAEVTNPGPSTFSRPTTQGLAATPPIPPPAARRASATRDSGAHDPAAIANRPTRPTLPPPPAAAGAAGAAGAAPRTTTPPPPPRATGAVPRATTPPPHLPRPATNTTLRATGAAPRAMTLPPPPPNTPTATLRATGATTPPPPDAARATGATPQVTATPRHLPRPAAGATTPPPVPNAGATPRATTPPLSALALAFAPADAITTSTTPTLSGSSPLPLPPEPPARPSSQPTSSFEYPVAADYSGEIASLLEPKALDASASLSWREREIGTQQVTRPSDWKALVGKLIAPTIVLVIIGIFVGGYFAFDGDGGKKPRTTPVEGQTITMTVTPGTAAGEVGAGAAGAANGALGGANSAERGANGGDSDGTVAGELGAANGALGGANAAGELAAGTLGGANGAELGTNGAASATPGGAMLGGPNRAGAAAGGANGAAAGGAATGGTNGATPGGGASGVANGATPGGAAAGDANGATPGGANSAANGANGAANGATPGGVNSAATGANGAANGATPGGANGAASGGANGAASGGANRTNSAAMGGATGGANRTNSAATGGANGGANRTNSAATGGANPAANGATTGSANGAASGGANSVAAGTAANGARSATSGRAALVDIRIDSNPAGATVMLVDRGKTSYLGTTPVRAAVDAARTYELVFSHAGRATRVEPLDPSAQQRVSVRLSRERAPVPAAKPAARAAAKSPATSDLDATIDRAVAKPPAATGEGTLMISSKPPCAILIDGKATGLTTPQRAITLPAGAHKVTLVNEAAGIKKTLSIRITADQPTKVIQDLMN